MTNQAPPPPPPPISSTVYLKKLEPRAWLGIGGGGGGVCYSIQETVIVIKQTVNNVAMYHEKS